MVARVCEDSSICLYHRHRILPQISVLAVKEGALVKIGQEDAKTCQAELKP